MRSPEPVRPPYGRIAVHGVPRSGTSWVGEILNSAPDVAYRYQPLFSYAHKDFLDGRSTAADVDTFFERLRRCEDPFTNQTERREAGQFPRFEKVAPRHVAYKEVRYHQLLPHLMQCAPDLRLCLVVRHPLSVLQSWLQAPREFRADLGWTVADEWRHAPRKNQGRPEEFNGYARWKQATTLFVELKAAWPARVHLLVYADLLADPAAEARAMFGALGVAWTAQSADFLCASASRHQADAYAVYRQGQRDDRWVGALDAGIVREVEDDLRGSALQAFLR